ncbi:MAG: response regulator [Planctomycetota bacterium]|jgi:two-component system chemotaxis response regulator CheY
MKKIVIADDSSTARMFIRRCLEIAGLDSVEFSEVENGKEALEYLKEYGADLLVTDLSMPVMGGVDLLKNIAASPKLNSTPVIVITSASNPAREKELLGLGAIAVLSKPVSPPDILDVVENIEGWED